MEIWTYAAVGAALLAVLGAGVLALREGRRRAELQSQLDAARADLRALNRRLDQLRADVDQARRDGERAQSAAETPVVVASVAEGGPREAEILHAIEAGRPQWVPAGVLRNGLVRTASLAHGVRRALSAEVRDRIALEMRAELRRSRRRRKAELRALRKHRRDGRNSAA